MKHLSLIGLPLLLAACHQVPAASPASSPLAMQGKALAQASCSRCHAIEVGRSSYSEARPFPSLPIRRV
jgi:mono/diheme cytochrome c family protein